LCCFFSNLVERKLVGYIASVVVSNSVTASPPTEIRPVFEQGEPLGKRDFIYVFAIYDEVRRLVFQELYFSSNLRTPASALGQALYLSTISLTHENHCSISLFCFSNSTSVVLRCCTSNLQID